MTAVSLSPEARAWLRTSEEAACGTPQGYIRHRSRMHEPPCGACAAAFDAQPGIPPVHRDSCGTQDGWRAHRYRSELPCDPCQEARTAYIRRRCGSTAGWMIHRRALERPCRQCRRAWLIARKAAEEKHRALTV